MNKQLNRFTVAWWQKFLNNKIERVIHNEHYIGVIVDQEQKRYENMKILFKSVNNEKIHRDYHRLKRSHNIFLDKNDEEMQYQSIDTNFKDIDIDKLEDVTNLFDDQNRNNNKLKDEHKIDLIGQYFSGKILNPGTLSKYKNRVKDHKSVFENDKDKWEQLYTDFEKRNKVMKYLKHHYTYVFIGKDKTYTFEHSGKKDLPLKYCQKNIIFNSYDLSKKISNTELITNENSSIATFFNNDKFPVFLNDYLDSIGIKKDANRVKGAEIEKQLSNNYCKCKTDRNGTKILGQCKDNHGTTRVIDGFIGEKISSEKLENYYDKEIDDIDKSHNIYTKNIDKIENEHKSYIEMDTLFNNSKGKKDKLKDKNHLYKQMIHDNILISNRDTLIRYLVIIILVFSILLIMKYINIL